MQYLRSLVAKAGPLGQVVFDAEVLNGEGRYATPTWVRGLTLEDFRSYERFQLRAALQGLAVDLSTIRGHASVRRDRWWEAVANAVRQAQQDAEAAGRQGMGGVVLS